MMTFKQYGYTPSNFSQLVKYSGLSNAEFMRTFGINKASFYFYKNGSHNMAWHNWQRVLSEVERYIETYNI